MNSAAGTLELGAWGVAWQAAPGEKACGDRHCILAAKGGVFFGAVDGLGHGEAASVAAQCAVDETAACAGSDLGAVIDHLHRALARTRGVTASLAFIDGPTGNMTWVGVGNVEAALVRQTPPDHERLFLAGGVVGHNLRRVRPATLPVRPGDAVVFATDGLREDFIQSFDRLADPESAAAQLVRTHARGTDDALAFVFRYTGAAQ